MLNKFKLSIRLGLFIFISVFVLVYSDSALAIRVGLLTNSSFANFAVSKEGSIIDGYTGRLITNLQGRQIYRISGGSHGLVLSLKGGSFNSNTNYIIIQTTQDGLVYAKNKWYRGSLIAYNTGTGVTIVNSIDIESYLMGVVPSEMPSKWNPEAHKAQAIAARSYAIANLGKRARYGYDLKDTPEDQAYGGASAENLRTNYAVEQTKGQVLVCGNKVIPAYYHSSSGGYTVNSGSVWLRDLPFVRSVPSFDGNLPKRGHGVGMSQYGANFLANYGYNAYQILGYFYKNVKLYRINGNL